MDKSHRRALKKQYQAEQRKNDPVYQFWSEWDAQLQTVQSVTEAQIQQWNDEELEWKIVSYVLNQFRKAGKPPKIQNLQQWERAVLLQLPPGVQAVFATYLFEIDLQLGGSFWDFFYQNNGAFAIEALNGYKLMSNSMMVEIMEQCIGAYLKMQEKGEIEELMGEPHYWEVDQDYYTAINKQDFESLDREYQQDKNFIQVQKEHKTQFIRRHTELFATGDFAG